MRIQSGGCGPRRDSRRRLIGAVGLVLVCNLTGQAEEKRKLFNGQDLSGWQGDAKLWSVRDGQIVGSTVDHKIDKNSFLIWEGGPVEDFRLTFQARLEGDNNSGVQYRSKRTDPKAWSVAGYQADIHANPPYTAMLYGEGTGRGIIALRGQQGTLETDPDRNEIDAKAFPVKPVDVAKWHDYSIEARGNRLIHKLDGKTTIDVTDNHEKRCDRGILALQVHAGPPMTVFFKDLVLETPAVQE
ncbi:MAG: DUF1080 domain-containing protein [Planctomycetota bacterium]